MCDFAAAMADRVIPRAPVRQWVLTVPHGLRGKMAYEPALTTEVSRQLIAAVSAWLRARARSLGIRGVIKTGAVTVIQRFNSALDVSPHFHVLFLDGVYSFSVGRKPLFHPTPAPPTTTSRASPPPSSAALNANSPVASPVLGSDDSSKERPF